MRRGHRHGSRRTRPHASGDPAREPDVDVDVARDEMDNRVHTYRGRRVRLMPVLPRLEGQRRPLGGGASRPFGVHRASFTR